MSYKNDGSYEAAFGEFAAMLRYGIPNPKRVGRRALLAAQPELRLRINPDPLRGILDFVVFKCLPGSSVARDEAIRGSDIDGGLVVLRQPAAAEAELAFVHELRAQGFTAAHPAEVAAALAACEDETAHNLLMEDYEAYRRLNRVYIDKDSSRIDFRTEAELRVIDPLTQVAKTHMNGVVIAEGRV